MINSAFLQKIGLTKEQISAIEDARREENRFRRLLIRSGVSVVAVDPIIRGTELDEVRGQKDDLLLEKIKIEFSDFITNKYQK